jgi:hypothetical protein
LRSDDDGDGAEEQGEAASPELAGEDSGFDYQQRRCQSRDEANGAERVTEHGTTDVSQEGNQRRLVDVSPGKVIAAGDVIELVPKVAVAVVEIDV